jgi:hypothetical protein
MSFESEKSGDVRFLNPLGGLDSDDDGDSIGGGEDGSAALLQDRLREGTWLEKRGQDNQKFKRRYFKLEGHQLKYYENETDTRLPLGEVDLRATRVGDEEGPIQAVEGEPAQFVLRTDGRDWVFRCEDDPLQDDSETAMTLAEWKHGLLSLATQFAKPAYVVRVS